MTEIERGLLIIGETRLEITVERGFLVFCGDLVMEARSSIEEAISDDPFFGITYDPYDYRGADDLIVRMCEASRKASVGPMATVAGAIAWYVADGLRSMGCCHAVIDNDGDLAISSDVPVAVSIHTGLPELSDVAMEVAPSDGVTGLCTSSGKVGHSVSLGGSDSVTVLAEDPLLADACATALGNMSHDPEGAVERIYAIPGVMSCMLVTGERVAVCGEFPLRSSSYIY